MKYRYQRIRFAKKATAPAAQTCYVVAYIRIASLDIMGVAFVMIVAFMPADKVHPKIALPAVCVVCFRLYCVVCHLLYTRGFHRVIHSKGDNLTRLTT